MLLLLAAAWLWVPRLPPRRAAVAIATVAGTGLLALPVAAALDRDTPWWDYESWDWFGREREVTFDWNHSYGPLDWPQEGHAPRVERRTPLLEGERPRSLRRIHLAARHGRRRSRRLSASPDGGLGGDPELHRNWLTQASFEVEALQSGLAVGSGVPQAIQGLDGVTASSDGTMSIDGEPLRTGDEY